jgi:phage-related minor tail protein
MPEIIDAVIDLIPVIVKALIDNLPKIVEAGIEIVKGLAKGIVENAPRLLAEAVGTLGNTLIDGVRNLLESRSPSKVFERIGEDVGDGLVIGIDKSVGAVSAAAARLAKASIPAGYEMVIGPKGPYLEMKSFTSGNSDKGVSDFGAASASFLLRQQGLSQAEIDEVLTKTIGGTLNQVNATMNRGVTLINEATNTMVMGNLSAADIAAKAADGFSVVEKIATPIDNLEGAISDLVDTIQAGNVGSILTPFAKGGVVTKPTAALIGEAGPEAVIPLNKMGQFGGATYQITVNAGLGTDGGDVGRQIVEAIKRYERRSGRVFVAA